jgi:mRNA interferase RelE/StbE
VSAATQIFAPEFDEVFYGLPIEVQRRIDDKLFAVGLRLTQFPHYRMSGSERFRLRIGDYRIIYRCDFQKNWLILLSIGHRREIYR